MQAKRRGQGSRATLIVKSPATTDFTLRPWYSTLTEGEFPINESKISRQALQLEQLAFTGWPCPGLHRCCGGIYGFTGAYRPSSQ